MRNLRNTEIEDKPASDYPTEIISKWKAKRVLDKFFIFSGNLRIQKTKTDKKEYIKAYEVRFVARNTAELDLIRNSLFALNYRICKGYMNKRRFIQPLYNKAITLKYKKLRERLRRKKLKSQSIML